VEIQNKTWFDNRATHEYICAYIYIYIIIFDIINNVYLSIYK
jgi:hypothetical protein